MSTPERIRERAGHRRATAWAHAPVALLRLSTDGLVLDANEVLLDWFAAAREGFVDVVHVNDLLTAGGRIFWETHVRPTLLLRGHVDEVALELETASGRRPVLLSARQGPRIDEADRLPGDGPPEDVVDAALLSSKERVRYERELLEARTTAERRTRRLTMLQTVARALAPATGVQELAERFTGEAITALPVEAVTLWVADDPETPVTLRASARRPRTRHDTSGNERCPHLDPPAVEASTVELPDGTYVLPLRPGLGARGALVVTPGTSAVSDGLDAETLETIADQASVALGRALLTERNRSISLQLQRAMLYGDPLDDARYRVESAYLPGVAALEVGGDWYDAFALRDGRVALVVGDVVGRGLEAATTMAQLRTAVRALTIPETTPAGVLDGLDTFVQRFGVGFGATVVCVLVDPATGAGQYACAGHLPPLVVGPQGGGHLLWGGRSTPLAVRAAPRTSGDVTLHPGECLVLYTDGVVERRNRNLRDGLRDFEHNVDQVVRPGGGIDLAAVRRYLEANSEHDDSCLLTYTWGGGGGPVPPGGLGGGPGLGPGAGGEVLGSGPRF